MSTQTIHGDATHTRTATTDLKLEVVVVPVSDVDRAKGFYEQLGWRLDADFASGADWRLVQMTPPGSPCSVMFGKGFTTAVPGSLQGTFLVVDDLESARTRLIGRGVEVSDVFHFQGDLLTALPKGRTPGRDPQGRSYFSFASFNDPDGNGWLLQEVTTRFPGRGLSADVATLRELLQEAEKRHGEYEAAAPKHHWSDWYAEYIVARERGERPNRRPKTPHKACRVGSDTEDMRYLVLLALIPILLFYGVYYLVLLLALPILVFYSTRLGFAIIIVTIILLYRSRVRTATTKVRRRFRDEEPPRRMPPWKDPWGTGTKDTRP